MAGSSRGANMWGAAGEVFDARWGFDGFSITVVKVQFDDFLFDADARQLPPRRGGDSPVAESDRSPPRAGGRASAGALQGGTARASLARHVRVRHEPCELVKEIRDALHDDARQPRYIRTAQRFGYAFCSAAAESPARATEVPVAPDGEDCAG
jgi:hypothetical protein